MALTFTSLIWTQKKYFEEAVETRQEEFDESIGHVLFLAQRSIELAETRATIEEEITATDTILRRQAHDEYTAIQNSIEQLSADEASLSSNYHAMMREDYKEMRREKMRQRFLYQKDLLNKAIYAILYKPLDKPISQRVDFSNLDQEIQEGLQRNGIDAKYHFSVTTVSGDVIYRCSDYEEPGNAKVYKRTIFPNDPPMYQGIINIHFPHSERYIYASARIFIPMLLLTIVLLITFIYTIWIIFRQKKLTEMKNDFVNNMTHEFKTPISTISLAAQMLSDPVVSKNEASLKRFAGIISDESKRLRFQVDKVLQTSLFEKGKATAFKMDELDANAVIEEVASTFTLKVHNVGGTIETALNAEDPIIFADQMHFTNVIFNLLDNALKYRRQNAEDAEGKAIALQLKVETHNEGNRLIISISDNGIGIKNEELKRIFKRFYRVSTGNVHDVKGFGLGLAYVESVVQAHKGRIHAESTFGKGTTFIISLPLMDA